MKKIIFVMGTMNIGGVEKSLLSLLQVLPEKEYKITILLMKKKGALLNEIPSWINVEEAPWSEEVKSIVINSPYHNVAELLKNRKLIRTLKYIYVYFYAKKTKNRYFFYKKAFQNVNCMEEEYDLAISYPGPNDIIDFFVGNKIKAKQKVSWVHFDVTKYQINNRLFTQLYNQYDKIFVVSRDALDKLIQCVPQIKAKAEVFYNIMTKDAILRLAQGKTEFFLDFEGIKIVTVGRLSIEKGQDLAIKVLSKLKQSNHKVKWYCIGEGNYRNELEKMVKEYNVVNDFIFLGGLANPYPFISQADIYVQPSRHEGYCLTLAEAKCLNKPIITTGFTGALEQISNGENGYIVQFDEDELYRKVKFLIDNPREKVRLSNRLSKEDINTSKEISKLTGLI